MTTTTRAATPPATAPAARPAESGHLPHTRTLRVALAGCGTVGGELLRLLDRVGPAIEARDGLRIRPVRVLVRDADRPRPHVPDARLLTADLHDFLATEADVVVEAIGGVEPAGTIARHALERGRAFVTANKALIAERGDRLVGLARGRGGSLGFEAAVAGGVPVVRVLRESLPHTGIRAIRGVLNGTTNYVLSRMAEGASFATALAEAQAKGFAEADPVRDLEGRDAADKIAILAWQAFGIRPGNLRVARAGLLPEPDRIVADAVAAGGVARLIAECARRPGGVVASVEPVVVPLGSPFARVAAEDNMVAFETDATGILRMSGPGAGGAPTAAALLSDIVTAAAAPVQPEDHGGAPAGSAGDPRRYLWLLSVRAGRTARRDVRAAAGKLGIELEEGGETGPDRVLRFGLPPLERHRARGLEEALAAEGLGPLVLRREADPPPAPGYRSR